MKEVKYWEELLELVRPQEHLHDERNKGYKRFKIKTNGWDNQLISAFKLLVVNCKT